MGARGLWGGDRCKQRREEQNAVEIMGRHGSQSCEVGARTGQVCKAGCLPPFTTVRVPSWEGVGLPGQQDPKGPEHPSSIRKGRLKFGPRGGFPV